MFWYHSRAYRLMPALPLNLYQSLFTSKKVFCNFAYFHFVHNGNFTGGEYLGLFVNILGAGGALSLIFIKTCDLKN